MDQQTQHPAAEAETTAPQATEDLVVYACFCRGFQTKRVGDMCLRCLDAYAQGLPYVARGRKLEVEMRRVARALQRHIGKQRITVGEALRAADRGLSPQARPKLVLPGQDEAA